MHLLEEWGIFSFLLPISNHLLYTFRRLTKYEVLEIVSVHEKWFLGVDDYVVKLDVCNANEIANESWDYHNKQLLFYRGNNVTMVVLVHRFDKVFPFQSDFESTNLTCI